MPGIAALPACSMFGGGGSRSSSTSARRQSYATTQSYNSGPEAGATQFAELTPDTIRSVQQNLQQDGLYHGSVDGVWGPATRTALRSYQQQHDMNPTGQLDQQTMTSMNQGTQRGGARPNEQPNYNPPPNSNPPATR